MRKLKRIEDECAEKESLIQKDGGGDKGDEFTRCTRKIAVDLMEARKMIKEREELEKSGGGSIHTVQLSADIRKKIKEATAEAQHLEAVQKREKGKYEKKNKEVPEEERKIDNRDELVTLVCEHIREVEAFNNRKHGDGAYISGPSGSNPTITELPDIPVEGFQILKENDKKINNILDDMSGTLIELKEISLNMKTEVELQGVMLDKTTIKVDSNIEQLETLNMKMRKALESIRKGNRFIIDLILLCVVLGIGGYIYSLFK